jgi:hypothetical protein
MTGAKLNAIRIKIGIALHFVSFVWSAFNGNYQSNCNSECQSESRRFSFYLLGSVFHDIPVAF